MIKEWNGKEVKAKHTRAFKAGIHHAALSVETHIKVEYQRDITGKGFSDKTSALRRSGDTLITEARGRIIAFVHFGFGMDYALHVENVAGGKYAYMGPGFAEMKPKLHGLFMTGAKTALALQQAL